MELKEARKEIHAFRALKLSGLKRSIETEVAIILDDRITELEAEVKRLEGQLLELNTLIQDVY